MTIFEIGVSQTHTCRSIPSFDRGHECFLFEPNPQQYVALKSMFANYSNVTIFNYAVGDQTADVKFFLNRETTPASNILNEQNLSFVMTKMLSMRDIDPGNIDILYLDTKGYEYLILQNMVSRPLQIHIVLNNLGSSEISQLIEEITIWAKNNNYQPPTQSKPNHYSLILQRDTERPVKQKDTTQAINELTKPSISTIQNIKPQKKSFLSRLIQRICGLWR